MDDFCMTQARCYCLEKILLQMKNLRAGKVMKIEKEKGILFYYKLLPLLFISIRWKWNIFYTLIETYATVTPSRKSVP